MPSYQTHPYSALHTTYPLPLPPPLTHHISQPKSTPTTIPTPIPSPTISISLPIPQKTIIRFKTHIPPYTQQQRHHNHPHILTSYPPHTHIIVHTISKPHSHKSPKNHGSQHPISHIPATCALISARPWQKPPETSAQVAGIWDPDIKYNRVQKARLHTTDHETRNEPPSIARDLPRPDVQAPFESRSGRQ